MSTNDHTTRHPTTHRPAVAAVNDELPVIDLIPAVDHGGVELWVSPDESAASDILDRATASAHGLVPLSPPPSVGHGIIRRGGARGRQETSGGVADDERDQPMSVLPQERFAAQSATDLARMIEQVRAAEQGDAAAVPVRVQPDGKISLSQPGQHLNVSTTLPQERFAAPPVRDLDAIAVLDPTNLCAWRWHEASSGWVLTLRPEVFVETEYTFLIRQEPARGNEWFAYCLAPNLDHLVGHRHHLQRLNGTTVVCLRPGFRGHASIPHVHAALAKWCIYIEFVERGLEPPFSE